MTPLLSRWLGGRTPPAEPARIPDGERVYAIGDVHGRLDLLQELLCAIEGDRRERGSIATTRLILLGDLIDRGPASAGVVELLRAGLPGFEAVEVLMGNHEEMLLNLLDAPDHGTLAHFLRVGGFPTMESYGVPERMLEAPDLHAPEQLLDHIPEAHRAWLRTLGDSVRVGGYLFVHAGIRPGVPLDEQQPGDLRWIRKPFLRSRADHGAVVVHGHTVVEQAEFLPNRIGIDTGAFATNRLTALGLEGEARWLLATGA